MGLIPVLGLEAIEQGTELEYVWYARIKDIDALVVQLEEAATDIVLQEQYQKLYTGMSQRVRRERNETCTYTVKTWQDGVQGKQETTLDINEVTFDELAREIDSGWLKLRFLLPVPEHSNLTYEVDVYCVSSDDGLYHPWVKVDVEVTEPLAQPLSLPFDAEEVVQRSHHNDEAVNRKIREICDGWGLDVATIETIKNNA